MPLLVAHAGAAAESDDAVAQAEERYWQLLAFSDKRRTHDAYDTSLAALERQVDQLLRGRLSTCNDLLKVQGGNYSGSYESRGVMDRKPMAAW